MARRALLSITDFACFDRRVAGIAVAMTEWRGALPLARVIAGLGCAADQKHSGKSHDQQNHPRRIYILHLLISLKKWFSASASRCHQFFLLAELSSAGCIGRVHTPGRTVALACNSLAISARPLLDWRDN
jgi:hypothetical protein